MKKGLTGVERSLRKQSTDTEQYLWRHLRDRQVEGFKFRRQQPIGRYIVDFVNLEKKVVIELDGGQHASDASDKMRDEWLRSDPSPWPSPPRDCVAISHSPFDMLRTNG